MNQPTDLHARLFCQPREQLRYKGPQLYNGQKFTRTLNTITLISTYDLGHIGLAGGQFIASAFYTSDGLNRVDGPNATRIGRLAYYQSLFDKRVELKIGYFDNAFEFLGTQTGGSFAGGTLGPQASVPNEVGLSYSGLGTPAVNIRINFKDHLYGKFGVQRSLPPGGATPEIAENPSGLRFHVPGTGVLMIGEWGWDEPASAANLATWIRVGGIYNTTNFPRFDGAQAKNNWATYIAVDQQVAKLDRLAPSRGLYFGATMNYAPQKENFVSKYYEVRIYGIGPVKRRPFDIASIVATANLYSRIGLDDRTAIGQRNFNVTLPPSHVSLDVETMLPS